MVGLTTSKAFKQWQLLMVSLDNVEAGTNERGAVVKIRGSSGDHHD